MPAERTIHVVDDDAAVRHSLERLLGSMGFATVSYTTPDAFLLAAPHLLDGCVLLDVKMPGISGLEGAGEAQGHWIRSTDHRPHRAGRYPDSRSRHESRRLRFPGEALR